MTKVYVVKSSFTDYPDSWNETHGAYFDKEKAELTKARMEDIYSAPPECPLPEGVDEYYDRAKWDLTTPDEDDMIEEWEELVEKTDHYCFTFIEELEVH